ncbi:sushi domain-containing protein 2-like [Lytechinus variegatus]|uniref:sushi domain-containing protein 2-like n=1 Tax=Lytechinus variegatus TaxID=7654 RepID=UPI001BB0E229|nr:sushi domain-containing protein 2-like [Lytechinus variegatus]
MFCIKIKTNQRNRLKTDRRYVTGNNVKSPDWSGLVSIDVFALICLEKVNSFQCILVLGGRFHGVIFNYDSIRWTSDIFNGGNQFTGLGGVPAQVGFNAGDDIHAFTLHPSQTEEVINMTILSNVNVPGRFVFRVDLPEIIDPACKEDTGTISLYPAIETMLGGNKIFIQGPCYDVTASNVVCKFKDTLSAGTVESPLRASCVSPTLFTAGDVAVHVSLDGGNTFPYTGNLQVEIPSSPMVFKVEEDKWLTSNELELMWDTQVLEGIETVNVVVYSYWEPLGHNGFQWETVQTLARGVAYSQGGLNFVKPEMNQVAEDGSDLMGVIGVVEDIDEGNNRIPRSIWSEVDSLQWLFPQNSSSWCTEWTNTNGVPEDHGFSDNRTSCPCLLRQAKRDLGRYMPRQDCRDDAWSRFPDNCEDRPGAFHCVIARPNGQKLADQECCYDRNGTLIEDRFAPSGFGVARHQSPITSLIPDGEGIEQGVPYFSHFYRDVIPEMHCCLFSSSEDVAGVLNVHCDRFMACRPSKSCRFYEVPKTASVFGASHISTFDGLGYTFPARGEYILLQTTEKDFLMQGRFERIDTGGGATSSVLTAIAIKQRNSDVIHVQTSPRFYLDLFVGRENQQFTLVDSFQSHTWSFKGVDVFYSDSVYQDGVQLYFDKGVAITVKTTGKSIRLITIAPPEFRNRTEGLLGSWNENPEDDLRLDDGTILSHDSLGEDIVTSFGSQWQIQEDAESLFYYLPGYSRDVYLNSQQPPITFNPEPETDPLTICDDSTLCAVDLAVSTNNRQFARGTLDAQNELQATRNDLKEVDKSFLMCSELSAPPHGVIVESTGRYFKDSDTFSCDDCYELTGNSTLSCQYDLQWSDDLPVCSREGSATCLVPGKPDNGTFRLATCNRTVNFSCNEGFALIGREQITCHNGSWDYDAPTCVVNVETTPMIKAATTTAKESTTSIITTTTKTKSTPNMTHVTSTAAPIIEGDGSDMPNEVLGQTPNVRIDSIISKEYRTYPEFIVWWVLISFVSIIVVALIVVTVFIALGFRTKSKKPEIASPGQQYELVENT